MRPSPHPTWLTGRISPSAKRRSAQLLGGSSQVLETVSLDARRDQVRILYAMIGPGVILQVGQSMENYARIIDAFRGIFLTTMALLIGLATGVGWFMARRAVSGVEAITRTARGISGGTLEKRVPVKGRGDEIDQLALTFNQMLDRIQTLVTEIRQMGDNIAHDLKSPLTRIRGIAEITLTTGESLSEYQAMAASAIEECDRLLDMINTMLMISKTKAGVDQARSGEDRPDASCPGCLRAFRDDGRRQGPDAGLRNPLKPVKSSGISDRFSGCSRTFWTMRSNTPLPGGSSGFWFRNAPAIRR